MIGGEPYTSICIRGQDGSQAGGGGAATRRMTRRCYLVVIALMIPPAAGGLVSPPVLSFGADIDFWILAVMACVGEYRVRAG